MTMRGFTPTLLTFLLLASAATLPAQRNRIAGPVRDTRRAELRGHIHPDARAEFDQGAADLSLVLPAITILLQPSAAQQADLEQFLKDQQDPTSPNYHHW